MMTVFSTAGDKIKEQEWGGMLPFYPEDILRDTGAIVIEKPLGTPHYIIDKVITHNSGVLILCRKSPLDRILTPQSCLQPIFLTN